MNPENICHWEKGWGMRITLIVLLCLVPATAWGQAPLPPLQTYRFIKNSEKVLPGDSTAKGSQYNCSGQMSSADQIGRVAVVSQLYQNGCYTDGRYNHRDFRAVWGRYGGAGAEVVGDAVQVFPAASQAKEFLGSPHMLYYAFPEKVDYRVYRLSAKGAIGLLREIPATQISQAGFSNVGINLSTLTSPETYVFLPAQVRLSPFSALENAVEGATLMETPLGRLEALGYPVPETPFDTPSGYTHGPDSHDNVYSQTRQFFLVQGVGEAVGVVFQGLPKGDIWLTWLGKDLRAPRTLKLETPAGHHLAAVTDDGKGTVYYLTIERGDGEKGNKKRAARLVRVNEAGQVEKEAVLDTSAGGMNIVTFHPGNVAALHYHNGLLGLMVGRILHRSSDGLNHQSGLGIIFDATSLQVVKSLGQTSGHSFENVLTHNGRGEFLGIDLADNYPRGVHLHRFGREAIESRVVFTFKTEHGEKPNSPAGVKYPLYKEISKGGKKRYKWSNDNRTYSELGGVTEGREGYTVVFSAEHHQGKALDNRRVGHFINDSRNIGLVLVSKDFKSPPYGLDKWNKVPKNLILTQGSNEVGGFFTFGGKWSGQENNGVVWLTGYKNPKTENVSRLKTVALPSGNILLLWEKWNASNYQSTHAMQVSPRGKIITKSIDLGPHVRLNRRDDPMLVGKAVYWVMGMGQARQLRLVRLVLK